MFGRTSTLLLLGMLASGLGSSSDPPEVTVADPARPSSTPGAAEAPESPAGRIFFVRQTIGDDANDGLSPEKAWRSLSKLSDAMRAGDTAYVGPGLYRDTILVANDGTEVNPITFVADTSGERTGDPPGVVMIAGSEPIDEAIFVATQTPGVYRAESLEYPVGGVVEMDGPQYRYLRVTTTREFIVDGLPELDVVAKYPASYFYDDAAKSVTIHTSDGKPPTTHEIELIRRSDGIAVSGKQYVIVIGFTFRHTADSGIRFWMGAKNGIAVQNTAYGCRQGIRVYGATNILVQGNTLFRNENSGVYFAKGSVDGHAVGNVLFENVKGLRWSSESAHGLAAGNVAFDNHEAGVSVENAGDVRVVGNRLVRNKRAQLFTLGVRPVADGNCFETGGPGRHLSEYMYTPYDALGAYQRGALRDHGSREGGCGELPVKLDVRALHAETTSYAERARQILLRTRKGDGAPDPPPSDVPR